MEEVGNGLNAEPEEEQQLFFTVAECGEYHSMGVYRDDIPSIEEAITLYKRIDPERLHGIPSIGIRRHTPGTDEWMDDQVDILTGSEIDLEFLKFVLPDLSADKRVDEAIRKLTAAFPDKEVRNNL